MNFLKRFLTALAAASLSIWIFWALGSLVGSMIYIAFDMVRAPHIGRCIGIAVGAIIGLVGAIAWIRKKNQEQWQ